MADPNQFGPYFAILNKDGTLRGNDDGDPYLFDHMGPHDNHTKHGRKVVRVLVVIEAADRPHDYESSRCWCGENNHRASQSDTQASGGTVDG